MAAGDGNAGRGANAFAAFEDLADHFQRQLVDRHADQGQGHDRRAAHGVHVADGVGRRDAAEVVGIVDDGHEKVRRGDQRLLVVEAVHGGVVGGLDADHEFLRHRKVAHAAQDFGKQAGRHLAAAAAAMAEGSQADRSCRRIWGVH